MKKFILSFTVAIMAFGMVQVQAQQITKLLGKTSFQQAGPFVNLKTDTLRGTRKFDEIGITFGLEFTNGNTPLNAGDTIFYNGYIAGEGLAPTDTAMSILTQGLPANEPIELTIVVGTTMGHFGGVISTQDSLSWLTFTATVFRTSQFVVNKTESTTLYYIEQAPPPKPAISETEIQAVKLYPNPVSSVLNIANLKNTKVEIFNVVGQRVVNLENVNGEQTVDMSEYPNGIYFVKIQSGKTVRTEKIKLVK